MSKQFIAKVNNNQVFEILETDLSAIDVVKTSENKQHILHKNTSYKAEVIESNFLEKTYKVKVNNTTYTINIENELDQLIKKMGFESSSSKQIQTIKASMPGLILELPITIGQAVKENDTLLILEAMKMENIITSPRDGIIKAILVTKGDAVEKQQLLIEFE